MEPAHLQRRACSTTEVTRTSARHITAVSNMGRLLRTRDGLALGGGSAGRREFAEGPAKDELGHRAQILF